MSYLYIIYSNKIDRFYIGITSENVADRIIKHNSSAYGRHFTSAANDWEIKLYIACENYSIARKMELYIKRMKSRVFINKIIDSEVEREKLISIIKSGN
jgi:putative endonuclease